MERTRFYFAFASDNLKLSTLGMDKMRMIVLPTPALLDVLSVTHLRTNLRHFTGSTTVLSKFA